MNWFQPGLASVTFRRLPPERIIALAAAAGLTCIEWAGDVHVPAGRTDTARRVGAATQNAGLAAYSYGSYYRVGTGLRQPPFEQIVETALALGAGNIRIWAGNRETVASPELRKLAVEETLAAAEIAWGSGLTISFEMHAGSLTENIASCLQFLDDARHSAVRTLWQPEPDQPLELSLDSLRSVLDHLQHIHVFFWRNGTRLPLSEGTDFWMPLLKLLRASAKPSIPLLMEFVPGDDPGIFDREAATLRQWLSVFAA